MNLQEIRSARLTCRHPAKNKNLSPGKAKLCFFNNAFSKFAPILQMFQEFLFTNKGLIPQRRLRVTEFSQVSGERIGWAFLVSRSNKTGAPPQLEVWITIALRDAICTIPFAASLKANNITITFRGIVLEINFASTQLQYVPSSLQLTGWSPMAVSPESDRISTINYCIGDIAVFLRASEVIMNHAFSICVAVITVIPLRLQFNDAFLKHGYLFRLISTPRSPRNHDTVNFNDLPP